MRRYFAAFLLLAGCLPLPAARLQVQVFAEAFLYIMPPTGNEFEIRCSKGASGPSADVACLDVSYPGVEVPVYSGASAGGNSQGFALSAYAANFGGVLEIPDGDEPTYVMGNASASASATYEGLFYIKGGRGVARFYLPDVFFAPTDEATVSYMYTIDGVEKYPFEARFGQPFQLRLFASLAVYPNFQGAGADITADLSQVIGPNGLYEMRELPEPSTLGMVTPALAALILLAKLPRRARSRLR